MAVNAAVLKAAKIIILTKVFEDVLKPPGPEEDSDELDGAAFTGAGGSIVAQQVAGLMAKAVIK
jgi:hypothetical protein